MSSCSVRGDSPVVAIRMEGKIPYCVPGPGQKVYRSTTTEVIENFEYLKDWEHTMACCIPWAYVWFKEGCGFSCFLNTLLSSIPCTYCFGVCHACSFIKDPPKKCSPCQVIAVHGLDVYRNNDDGPRPLPITGSVVMKQPMRMLN